MKKQFFQDENHIVYEILLNKDLKKRKKIYNSLVLLLKGIIFYVFKSLL